MALPKITSDSDAENGIVFNDVFSNVDLWEDSQVVRHCLDKDVIETDHEQQVCNARMPTRDKWLKAMDENCAAGEAYCWMGCYPLPEECPSVEQSRYD